MFLVDTNVLLDIFTDDALPLPGFYIGAHAAADGQTLVTRDVGRYPYRTASRR